MPGTALTGHTVKPVCVMPREGGPSAPRTPAQSSLAFLPFATTPYAERVPILQTEFRFWKAERHPASQPQG